MKNRLQFLLRKNAGKQHLEIYQEEVSKLVIISVPLKWDELNN